jgi:hypothetical protein
MKIDASRADASTGAFAPFEWMIAFRYLRARKGERFVSVIAIFSLVGIALGVATLIIVMSVMNGFRHELLGRILGLNGHLGVYAVGTSFTDFDDVAGRIRGIPGVVSATPIVEGQVLITSDSGGAAGGLARGCSTPSRIAPALRFPCRACVMRCTGPRTGRPMACVARTWGASRWGPRPTCAPST